MPRRTWFQHRRMRPTDGDGRRTGNDEGGRAAAERATPGAGSVPESVSVPVGEIEPDPDSVLREDATIGGAPEVPIVREVLPPAGANGMCIPGDIFKRHIDTFVSYTFLRQHRQTREAASDYLRQRGRMSTCRTVKELNAFVESSMDVHELRVDCCPEGCVAFTADRKLYNSCDYCGSPRFKNTGSPTKQVVYWRLASWLRMLLADPSIGPGMVRGVAQA